MKPSLFWWKLGLFESWWVVGLEQRSEMCSSKDSLVARSSTRAQAFKDKKTLKLITVNIANTINVRPAVPGK